MTKTMKLITIMLSVFVLLAIINMPVYAAQETIEKAGNKILSIAGTIGMIFAVVMLIWLGIKYVSASPTEKADIKKGMTIYIVGAILILAAGAILTFIGNFATGIFGDTTTIQKPSYLTSTQQEPIGDIGR